MTGLTSPSPEIGAKRVKLLREAFPKMSRLAVVLHSAEFPGVGAQQAMSPRFWGGRNPAIFRWSSRSNSSW